MEEKGCKNCGWYISKKCTRPSLGQNDFCLKKYWKPKGENMDKNCENCFYEGDWDLCREEVGRCESANKWTAKKTESLETIQSFEECDLYETCGEYRKLKDKTMNDKIQMTEEQAREILDECACTETCDFKIDETISVMKRKGYIIKSELQQKVERVEASLKEYIDGHSVDILDTFKASIDVIQLLKQSHPEFKEK